MLVTLSLVLFQLRLETNIYVSMRDVNRGEIPCLRELRELRKEINCVIVARINAQRKLDLKDDVNESLRSLIDRLTCKVEKSVIDCKEIEFEAFELCLRFCACDERDLWLIEVQTRDVLSLINVLSAILQVELKWSMIRICRMSEEDALVCMLQKFDFCSFFANMT